jgi:hypothetical protein
MSIGQQMYQGYYLECPLSAIKTSSVGLVFQMPPRPPHLFTLSLLAAGLLGQAAGDLRDRWGSPVSCTSGAALQEYEQAVLSYASLRGDIIGHLNKVSVREKRGLIPRARTRCFGFDEAARFRDLRHMCPLLRLSATYAMLTGHHARS